MSQCPECKVLNLHSSKFCTSCGFAFDQSLAAFLDANGLGEHLDVLQRNDLFTLADLLQLEAPDLAELKLPYGDMVRLRTVIQELRQSQSRHVAAAQEPQPKDSDAYEGAQLSMPAAISSLLPESQTVSGQAKSNTLKIAAIIFGVLGLLFLRSFFTKPTEIQKTSEPSQTDAQMSSVSGEVVSPQYQGTHAKNTPQLEATASLHAFSNSFGHRMIPVPGTQVLFSIWPVRVSDYKQFAQETGTQWKEAGFPQAPSHPAVRVNHYNARAFCKWLTQREQEVGKLPAGYEYRLPRDLEWSAAAGIKENPDGPPAWRSGSIPDCFPWGNVWPPPYGSGNYDSRLQTDSFPYTSPVGSFAPNRYGLYDMSGNVFEWVDEDFDQSGLGCLRGGSWPDESPVNLNLSTRCQDNKTTAHKCYGFRYVLAPVSQ